MPRFPANPESDPPRIEFWKFCICSDSAVPAEQALLRPSVQRTGFDGGKSRGCVPHQAGNHIAHLAALGVDVVLCGCVGSPGAVSELPSSSDLLPALLLDVGNLRSKHRRLLRGIAGENVVIETRCVLEDRPRRDSAQTLQSGRSDSSRRRAVPFDPARIEPSSSHKITSRCLYL